MTPTAPDQHGHRPSTPNPKRSSPPVRFLICDGAGQFTRTFEAALAGSGIIARSGHPIERHTTCGGLIVVHHGESSTAASSRPTPSCAASHTRRAVRPLMAQVASTMNSTAGNQMRSTSPFDMVERSATTTPAGDVLGMPPGQLGRTVDAYNAFAAEGEDPLFYKVADYLRPLADGPFGALDCTVTGSVYAVLTLGGLHTRAPGEAVGIDGNVVPGLFAAGRVAAGLPLEGRTYASGLSIGDATFFGRVAGRNAAALGH